MAYLLTGWLEAIAHACCISAGQSTQLLIVTHNKNISGYRSKKDVSSESSRVSSQSRFFLGEECRYLNFYLWNTSNKSQ